MNWLLEKYPRKLLLSGLLLAGLTDPLALMAQVNVSGKPGLLYIPSARAVDDGTFWFSYTYNPIKYAFRFRNISTESIVSVNLALLPRLEINVNLLIPNQAVRLQDRGIGDRQIDFKYGILKETTKRPSVAVILSAPFGIDNSLETYALVATKNLKLTDAVNAEVTAGLGSPYYIYRNVKNDQNSGIFSGFTLRDKREKSTSYLSGPYGGINISFRKKAGLMVEWDSQHLNVGAYGIVCKRWTVQGGLLNGDQVILGTSYAFSLLHPSKRLSVQHAAN